jgi:hypothetical protein
MKYWSSSVLDEPVHTFVTAFDHTTLPQAHDHHSHRYKSSPYMLGVL